MDWRDHIDLNPLVLGGKPVVRGTRISVELVLDMIAAGVDEGEILRNYPRLGVQSIRACAAYASEILKGDKSYPLSG